jgi:hypothetical protein
MRGIDTKAVRKLAKDLGPCWLADTLNHCADEIDALRGQALSDPEREEYFAMKKKAAEYDTLRELVREALRGFLHGHDTNFIERAEKALNADR